MNPWSLPKRYFTNRLKGEIWHGSLLHGKNTHHCLSIAFILAINEPIYFPTYYCHLCFHSPFLPLLTYNVTISYPPSLYSSSPPIFPFPFFYCLHFIPPLHSFTFHYQFFSSSTIWIWFFSSCLHPQSDSGYIKFFEKGVTIDGGGDRGLVLPNHRETSRVVQLPSQLVTEKFSVSLHF